ncbi:hypothetical protein GH742_01500 [Legionella sp. MW5194]|uniref:hypothetical protein n=1 Tax=Legionella sp. MW5194 TaxID=2662448 RepID=UPI00193EA446|nr:hypothetical protein [Legionella sp. MW5194]QRN02655.1 hypothetical protein GH742_01500 [Legionella sp. MW5194]
MSLPPVTRKATLKVIAKAKKAGINLNKLVPAVFLEESDSSKSEPAKAGLQDLQGLFALTSQKMKDKERYYVEALIAAHLKDMEKALQVNKIAEKKKSNWFNKLKLILLVVAGTVFFGCEGFDGITALLGIFNLPTVGIFVAGTVFSVLSILVFYAFDLVEISHNLGVNLKSAPKMVDLYIKELESIKALRIKINSEWRKKQASEELEEYIQLIEALKAHREEILKDAETLKKSLERPVLKAAKLVTAAITGVIFFSGGFFAGQTVALAIAGAIGASVSATFWPIILVSVGVGLAALAVYWFVERPGIENLIGRMIGLDKEKIDKLTDKSENHDENLEMQSLLDNINHQKNQLTVVSRTQEELDKEKSAQVGANETIGRLKKDVEHFRTHNNELVIDNERLGKNLTQASEEMQKVIFEKEKATDAAVDRGNQLKEAQEKLKEMEETKKLLEKTRQENLRLQSALEKETQRVNELGNALGLEKKAKGKLEQKVSQLELALLRPDAEPIRVPVEKPTNVLSAESVELADEKKKPNPLDEKKESPLVALSLFPTAQTKPALSAAVVNATYTREQASNNQVFT